MKIAGLILDGFRKSIRSLKIIILLWVISLTGSVLVVAPLQRNIARVLDGTIAYELFYEGFNIDVFADIMHAILPALASFSISFFLVTAILFLANTFITSGIFRVLAGSWKKPYKRNMFLKGADRGFGGFLFVALVTGILFFLLCLLICIIPVTIVVAAGGDETTVITVAIIGVLLIFVLSPVLLLMADYARALITSDKWLSPFRAMLGGFKLTVKWFRRGWIIMMLILATSLLVSYLAVNVVLYSKAESGGSLFLLLIISQLFIFIKIWLKVIRYGTVTAMFESGKKSAKNKGS
jgi:hypothetical protein